MKNNNKILYISIAILVLAVGLVIGTIAYYQTTISGTITGTVAKWSFKANNQTSTFNLDFGSLYPGKTGTYNLELSAEDSDLPVYYEFIVHGYGGYSGDMALKNALHSRIYFDDAYTLSLDGSDNSPYASYVGAAGFIEAGEKITIPLYYNWPYDGQIDNPSYADGTLKTLPISIVGIQDPQMAYPITEAGPAGILFDTSLTYNIQENQIIPIAACGTDSFNYSNCVGNFSAYDFTARDASSVWITIVE